MMVVGTVQEQAEGERRVAITPETAGNMTDQGLEVLLEQGAGQKAHFPDQAYEDQGAEIVADRDEVLERTDVLFQVRGLAADPEHAQQILEETHPGQLLVGLMNPYGDEEIKEEAANREVTVLALELIPRISRAQSMDALTSQSNIGGYMATLLAARRLPKLFPMMMTAAGTVRPASVFVIGAGVAGLQAIATARRLGADVQGYDIRLEVKEQVESLGADFVELDLETEEGEDESGYAREMDETFYQKQREKMREVTEYSDVVITTANIPGKPAPELVSEEMVEQMQSGSVIVDLAADNGGNCTLTEKDEHVQAHGVTILGPTDLPSDAAQTASKLYATNLWNLLEEFTEEATLNLDRDDEIIDSILLVHEGEVLNPHLKNTDQ